jgi:hypothetical protein
MPPDPGRRQGGRSRSRPVNVQQNVVAESGSWQLVVPSSRSSAVCSTCCSVLPPRSVRLRKGATHARVHHLACVAHLCGPLEQLPGWSDLADAQRSQARTAAQAGLATASAGLAAEPPEADEAMELDGAAASNTGPPTVSSSGSNSPVPLSLLDKTLRNLGFG